MLLFPKRVKYPKIRKGRCRPKKLEHPNLIFGNAGIIAIEAGYIEAKQIEASRQTINRHLNKKGKIRIIIFPSLGVTKKPDQIRIGKGVGKTKYWVFKTNPGKMILEVSSANRDQTLIALNSGAQKLPIDVRIVFN
jgi:large subunit ribosomal protein L16